MAEDTVYPYIPNSVRAVRERMLETIGISSVEEIYKEIPDHLRFKRPLNTPGPIPSEYALRRHCEELLEDGADCKRYIGFLGGGVWHHHVPSVVTTIMERDEFLTSYVGEAYADHGKWQAQFEYASCIAELLEMDAVNTPTYDWGMAAASSIRMAARITGRSVALVAATVSPDRLSCMKNYGFSAVPTFITVEVDPQKAALSAMELRPELQAETFRAQMDALAVNLAISRRYPTLFLAGDYDFTDQRFPLLNNSWNVGVGIKLPFTYDVLTKLRQKRAEQRQGQLKRAALQDQVRLEVRQACDQLGYWKLESGLRSQQFRTVSGIYQKAAPAAAASLGKLRALMTVIEMRLSTLESVTESTLARARLERAMGRDLAP